MTSDAVPQIVDTVDGQAGESTETPLDGGHRIE
jgi:hypothetical protein